MKNKLIQVKSDEVFKLLSEGNTVYRLGIDDSRLCDLDYEQAGDIWKLVNGYGDDGDYVYFIVETKEEAE